MSLYAKEKLEEWRMISMTTLFSTDFKNGYCIIVQYNPFEAIYSVILYHFSDITDIHTAEFHNAVEVFGYMADVQRYKPKE